MADGLISFHHDITVIVKDYLCVSQLFDFIRHLLLILSIFRFMALYFKGNWILQINSTI